MQSVQLLIASDADLGPAAALMNLAYGGRGQAPSWTHVSEYLVGDRTSEAALRAQLAANPQARLLLAKHDDERSLGGLVWLEPRSRDLWYLGSLTVDPSRQSAGLGGRILDSAERWIRARGARVQIDVLNVRAALIAWYQRRGYRLTGESQRYPYEDNRYGVPQRPDLAFVVLEKALP